MNISSRTYDMVVVALLTAITYVATLINFQPPISLQSGGLIHFGNVMIVVSAIVFGKKKAAISGAFGMALFDLTTQYVIWAPFTFVIRGAMGYTIGSVSHMRNNGSNTVFNIIAIVIASVIQIVGYYFAEVVLFGNPFSPILSIPGELTQIAFSFVGLPIAMVIKRAIGAGK